MSSESASTTFEDDDITSAVHEEFHSLFEKLACRDLEALDQVKKLAGERHDPLAQAMLAISLCAGLGFTNKDLEKGNEFGRRCLNWISLHSDKNAFFCLGWFHYFGIAMEVNKDAGLEYWKMAADAGSELAMSELGYHHLTDDPELAFDLFKIAASTGYVVAQNNLGNCYFDGIGTEADFIEAALIYQTVAAKGYSHGINTLGVCYETGLGVVKDVDEALRLHHIAAAQGNRDAFYSLGRFYASEKGFPDREEAIKWFKLAAELGDKDAMQELSRLED